MLLEDAIRLGDATHAAGVECRVVIWPGMMHVFQSTAPFLPDARRAGQQLAAFIASRVAAV